jgi:hypothetical protein
MVVIVWGGKPQSADNLTAAFAAMGLERGYSVLEIATL